MTAGSPDINFKIGVGFLNNDTSNGVVYTIDVDSSNNIFCGGLYQNYSGNPINNIVKLDNNGNLDLIFLANTSGGTVGEILDLKVLNDDTVILAGGFTYYGPTSINNIIKINNDGTVDSTFNSGGGFNDYVTKIGIQSDGKIIAIGKFNTYDGNACSSITRINTDGTFDNTFNIGSGFDGLPRSLTILPDDSIIIVGEFNNYDGNNNNYIVKLLADGTQDFTFNNLGFDGYALSVDTQSDGKIIVGGLYSYYGTNYSIGITRLNSDGSFDNTFLLNNFSNIIILPIITTLYVLSDDRICIGNSDLTQIYDTYWNIYPYTLGSFAVLKSNGDLDNDFVTGVGFDPSDICFKQDNNNKLLIGGTFTTYNGIYTYNSLIRLETQTPTVSLSAGSIDNSFIIERGFNLGTYHNKSAQNLDFLSDGSLILIGAQIIYNNVSIGYVTKLLESGSLDMIFNTNILSLSYDDSPIDIKIQSDNKIITIGGYSSPTAQITRLNSDGTLDTSFLQNYGSGINGNLITIDLQNDNIILGFNGYGFNSGGTAWNGIFRLFSNGDVDELFNFGGTGFDIFGGDQVVKILVQPYDNKILVGGTFKDYNGVVVPYNLIRLNSDGSLDTTFNFGGIGFDSDVYDIALQSDNKILILGNFTTYNGVSVGPYIVRLNADGSLDTTFNITDIDYPFNSISIQSDDKIILQSTDNTTINGTSLYPAKYSILRLNTDGSIDNTFHIGYGADSIIYKIKINNNKIYAIGDFTTYDS